MATRSLLHLTQDMAAQLEQAQDKRNKKSEHKHRPIRKLTEKMLK